MITCQTIIDRRKALWQADHDITRDRAYRDAVADYILQHKHIRQEIADYPELLIEMCFVIVDKDKQTTPFFLNEVQHDFVDKLNQCVAEYRAGERTSIKLAVLKGRQQGFTSFITAYQLACTISRKNFEGFTAADEDGNTTAIFENKAKHLYSLLPEKLKPTEKYNNRKQMLFDKLHSSWEVKTASRNMGRSRTINFFHGSEAAFWKDGISGTQAGIGEALTKDSVQIFESTANGYNEYKELWDAKLWENCFYEWWRTPEYRMPFESEERANWFRGIVQDGKSWIAERIRWLEKDIKLEPSQVYWYYSKWAGYIDKELIKQEYPCSPIEAFLASGRSVFDKEKLIQRIAYLEKLYADNPPRRGVFRFKWRDAETQDMIIDNTIEWVDDKNGPITLYSAPVQFFPYVIGGDTKGEGKDMYAATVIDNVSGRRVATLHLAATNSKPYTWQVYCLGRFYNDALIGIEMNFNTAPIEELQRLRYPRQYVRQQYDSMTKETQQKYGWKTDGNTRPLIIDKTVDLIENNIDLFTDITFLTEALTFVYDKNGRPDAEAGKHDDVLISDMIANEIRRQQSFTLMTVTPEAPKHGFPFHSTTDNSGGYAEW